MVIKCDQSDLLDLLKDLMYFHVCLQLKIYNGQICGDCLKMALALLLAAISSLESDCCGGACWSHAALLLTHCVIQCSLAADSLFCIFSLA